MTGSRVVRLLTLGIVAAFVAAVTAEAMGTGAAFGTPEQKARAQGKGNGGGGGNGAEAAATAAVATAAAARTTSTSPWT